MALTMRLSRVVARRSPTTLTLTLTRTQTRRFTQSLDQPFQIYRSTSTDPYVNLSIEHHLLQNSHPDSTILFLYVNRPSIVIGRNQNPWLEVNLRQLPRGLKPQLKHSEAQFRLPQPRPDPIMLVRRRSGGGTVFHDLGNTNYSVICPPAAFDRDRHAEMVVRALKRLDVSGARVNERHDIVNDVGKWPHSETFKVSGSAYKLTRTRALHHGTCLLTTENMTGISNLLKSPAAGFIKARGVESVRSRIKSVWLDGDAFAETVVGEFRQMYGYWAGAVQVVSEEAAMANEDVVKGVKELSDPDWIFGQTPQFTFSTHWHPSKDDPEAQPAVLPGQDGQPGEGRKVPDGFKASFTIRHGKIESANISGLPYHHHFGTTQETLDAALSAALTKVDGRLYNIRTWREHFLLAGQAGNVPFKATGPRNYELGTWLNAMFGILSPSRTLAEMFQHSRFPAPGRPVADLPGPDASAQPSPMPARPVADLPGWNASPQPSQKPATGRPVADLRGWDATD